MTDDSRPWAYDLGDGGLLIPLGEEAERLAQMETVTVRRPQIRHGLLEPMPSGLPCLVLLAGNRCACPVHYGEPCAGPGEREGHQHDSDCIHG